MEENYNERIFKVKKIVTVTQNNDSCVVLTVKDNKSNQLIGLGVFNGNEESFRLTKGPDITCTVFYKGTGESFSWYWGATGHTLVTDEVSKMGKMIQKCIELAFDIRVQGELDTIIQQNVYSNKKHQIELMGWPNPNYVVCHKDGTYLTTFKSVAEAIDELKELGWEIGDIKDSIAKTGCWVKTFNISKSTEKTFKLPVSWQVYSVVEIKANSLEEAVLWARRHKDDIALPTDSDYIDGSFVIESETGTENKNKVDKVDLDYYKIFNI